ncbi:MAG TPA: hypothetical protein VLG66_17815 [Alphaproteobacteria bacterium]|nr:hypothetical protein [Alphaproteobacteria bacterium]
MIGAAFQYLIMPSTARIWWRAKLLEEFLILRHQLNVLRRATPWRVALTNLDHGLFVAPYRA